jgi:hypothetical protein
MVEQHNGADVTAPVANAEIAGCFEEIAELLEAQDANPFRVRAYRNGAATLRRLDTPARMLLEQGGIDALERLEGIGQSLARAIEQFVCGGKVPLLQRLRGEIQPSRIFTTVAGIGPVLAERIHETLDIETLADLHAAACDGRLATVPGFGPKRVRAVRESLEGRLRWRNLPQARRADLRHPAPGVEVLLDLDREYRKKAAADRLPRIAPLRFNPRREAWLPILHATRGASHFTVLYSNTARAHELGTTHDWVVIYRDDRDGDGQWTVITSRFGALLGKRVVRGREAECRAYYAEYATAPDGVSEAESPAPAS